MKKILHLSDLHFGTERSQLLSKLIDDILRIQPDLLIVSGDLTQRATKKQYQLANEFLSHFKRLSTLCVPGNHDIPLYNLFLRFLKPYSNYKRWISSSLSPAYIDEKIAVLGVNSATPYQRMSGYLTDKQLAVITEFFNKVPEKTIRIMVMHHNLIKSERHKIINNADKIINNLMKAKVDIVLSGHIHQACVEKIQNKNLKDNLYIITAGTPISHRTLQPNSYNIIEIHDKYFTITVRSWQNNHFIENPIKLLPYEKELMGD